MQPAAVRAMADPHLVDALLPTIAEEVTAATGGTGRALVTVATLDYVPLLRNLLCSVAAAMRAGRWLASHKGLFVAAADSGVCAQLAGAEGLGACVEPSRPHLATAAVAYSFKLAVVQRCVHLPHVGSGGQTVARSD